MKIKGKSNEKSKFEIHLRHFGTLLCQNHVIIFEKFGRSIVTVFDKHDVGRETPISAYNIVGLVHDIYIPQPKRLCGNGKIEIISISVVP